MFTPESLKQLFAALLDGSVSTEDAITALRHLPYEELSFAKLDHHRALRQGFPEVVLCDPKSPEHVAEIMHGLAARHSRILGTRASKKHFDVARALVPDLNYDPIARTIWRDDGQARELRKGIVILSAGTADIPVAEEAWRTLYLLGYESDRVYDVGVAGIHRLFAQIDRLRAATTIVVVAGMEGALTSVVGGLVSVPVIGVPTSVGYGASFSGVSALLTMLNSCAAGIGVVNIDNGFGAACLAAAINNLPRSERVANKASEKPAPIASESDPLRQKLGQLRAAIRALGSTVVAYSGGVDSALVALVAHQELGMHMRACIGVSPSYPRRELKTALAALRDHHIPFQLVRTYEYRDVRYVTNPKNRCFFCKEELFSRLRQIASREGFMQIVDGTNASDNERDRPSLPAARAAQVHSPLRECGITKREVRLLAKALGLSVWDKPAMACLASRIPHGSEVTPKKLATVEAAEDMLAELGFTQFRVRHHDTVARIVIPKDSFESAIRNRACICAAFKKLGYQHTVLDLNEYPTEQEMTEDPLVLIKPQAELSRSRENSVDISHSDVH